MKKIKRISVFTLILLALIISPASADSVKDNNRINDIIVPYAMVLEKPVNEKVEKTLYHNGQKKTVGVRIYGDYTISNSSGVWKVISRNLNVHVINDNPYVVTITSVNFSNGANSVTVSGTYQIREIYGTSNILLGAFDFSKQV